VKGKNQGKSRKNLANRNKEIQEKTSEIEEESREMLAQKLVRTKRKKTGLMLAKSSSRINQSPQH
jgi:hypothetical protein